MPFSKENLDACCQKGLVQLGIVFPNASAVYLCCWCGSFECDGPSLIFFSRSGMFWASAGHVTPNIGAAF